VKGIIIAIAIFTVLICLPKIWTIVIISAIFLGLVVVAFSFSGWESGEEQEKRLATERMRYHNLSEEQRQAECGLFLSKITNSYFLEKPVIQAINGFPAELTAVHFVSISTGQPIECQNRFGISMD